MVVVSLEPAEHRLGLRMVGVKGKTGRKADAVSKAGEEEKKSEEPVVVAEVEVEVEKQAE
jgi:hypothetical protein